MDFDITDQLQITYSLFIKYWRKMGVQWNGTLATYRLQENL